MAGGVCRFTLHYRAQDLGGLTRAAFAIWDNQRLIENYEVRAISNPAVVIAGFIAPPLSSGDESYSKAVGDGLGRCLTMKRPDNLWRIDRYSVEAHTGEAGPGDQSAFPYDETFITSELKCGTAASRTRAS